MGKAQSKRRAASEKGQSKEKTSTQYGKLPSKVVQPLALMLGNPWRNIEWGQRAALLAKINKYVPTDGEQHLRVLVYGPVGAGKSSFINSVATALYGRMVIVAGANTSDSDTKSYTLKYQTHRLYKDAGYSEECYPFVFNDLMGMEEGDRTGIHPEDIKLAMMGHVKEGYKFNPMSPLSREDWYYNPNPTIDDKVHVLVLLLSANCPEIDPMVVQKMKEVRESAHDLRIPQIAVCTHIEELCPVIESNLRNVYRSQALKTKMDEFSHAVGIPLNCIMGVKNYSEETDNVENIDTLLLIALRNIVNFGKDFVRGEGSKRPSAVPDPDLTQGRPKRVTVAQVLGQVES